MEGTTSTWRRCHGECEAATHERWRGWPLQAAAAAAAAGASQRRARVGEHGCHGEFSRAGRDEPVDLNDETSPAAGAHRRSSAERSSKQNIDQSNVVNYQLNLMFMELV
uniref:Uncharacterized protein n=1 Tax=Leersia perrieri TaxID=77586 RepID=A0A0D9XUJ8_9ORYZ